MSQSARMRRLLESSLIEQREKRSARRRLASMDPERRAQLEREWLEAEDAAWPPPRITPELIARANAEWEADHG